MSFVKSELLDPLTGIVHKQASKQERKKVVQSVTMQKIMFLSVENFVLLG